MVLMALMVLEALLTYGFRMMMYGPHSIGTTAVFPHGVFSLTRIEPVPP